MLALLWIPLLLTPAPLPAVDPSGLAWQVQEQFETHYLQHEPEHDPPCSARRRLVACEEAVAAGRDAGTRVAAERWPRR